MTDASSEIATSSIPPAAEPSGSSEPFGPIGSPAEPPSPASASAEVVIAPPQVRMQRGVGVGAMGPRVRSDDALAPPREVVEQAAHAARSSGHRFDLMRYLRLRRKR